MKRLKLILGAALLLLGSATFAQENKAGEFRFAAGAEAAVPLGDLGKVTSFGLGAFAMADYGLMDKLHLQGSVGYLYFLAKGGYVGTFGVVPVKAGLAYYLTEQFNVQAGAGFASVTGGSGLHYYGGLGYDLENIGFSVQYNGISNNGFNSSWVGLRAAYKFGD